MSPSAGAPGAASRRGWSILTTSGGPGDGGPTSRGAPFRTEMGTFLFWAVHWGMSDRYIVGFARLVYCYYCLTDVSKLFCGTYNIDICMTIWHLLFTVFCPDKVKMMYQQHDVLMETVKMHCQKMYMIWNKVLWKKNTKNMPQPSIIEKKIYLYIWSMLVNSSPPSAAYMPQPTGSALFQIIACRLFGVKPLPKPMLTYC